MKRVDDYDKRMYNNFKRWALDALLFGVLVVALLAFFTSCTGTGEPDSPASTGRAQLGIVAGALFAQTLDIAGSDSEPTGACCYEKPRPDGTFIDECGNNKTEAWCADRQNSTWSEGLSCNEVSCPAIELGSCCFDCVEESGDSDTCEDEATEAWCDEEGGSWQLETPCGERQDCNDECPMTPVGAICTPPGWPPSDAPDPELVPCVGGITLDECNDLFNDEYCANGWEENATCKDLVCSVPVPAMPWWAYALLPVLVAPGAWYLMRRAARR